MIWDRLLAADAQSREDVALLLARAMHAKAYVSYVLDRDADAQTVAREAADLAGSLAGVEAQVVAAQIMGVQRSALSRLGQQGVALAIDQRLVEQYADSDSFALRLCAGRALEHEIWVRRSAKKKSAGSRALSGWSRFFELMKIRRIWWRSASCCSQALRR